MERQRGFSLIELMVAATVLSVVGLLVMKTGSSVQRAQSDLSQTQTLDMLEQNIRKEMLLESSSAVMALFQNSSLVLQSCLNGVLCTSGSRYEVFFVSADNLSIPPRYRLSGEPCPFDNTASVSLCPLILKTWVTPLCELGVPICAKAQGLMIDYLLGPQEGVSADVGRLAVRQGSVLVRFQ